MSYNQLDIDFLNKLELLPEENEVEDVIDEFDQTNTPVFNSN